MEAEMEQQTEEQSLATQVAETFIGQWRKLVSTTNWEKGRIIHEWRLALIASDAPQTEFSDEAWSRIIGGSVTGQHAGRLRRVYDRFGQTYDQYKGLFWSHFQSAVDWDDAEMWLEGAVQNNWSISAMRRERWQTTGAIESEKPVDQDVVASESDVDEDCDPSDDEGPDQIERTISGSAEYADSVVPEGPDFGDEENSRTGDDNADYSDDAEGLPLIRPFENLADLPDDLGEAFESFKLAILRHKTSDWDQISRDDVLASLDALKELTLAPSAD
jgi:hypothetical protein